MTKQLKTKKLHYGKYLYKATFTNSVAFTFASYRNPSADRLRLAKEVIQTLHNQHKSKQSLNINVWRTQRKIPYSDYIESTRILSLLESHNDWRIRVENMQYLAIYTSNLDLINELEVDCGACAVYRPEEGIENYLLLNVHTAIVNTPSDYEYKVYLKGNKLDTGLGNWLVANTDKSKVGDQTLHNIQNGWGTSGNYFYIKNDKVLTIIRMLAGHNIRRVEKLVYKEDIDKYLYGDNK